MPGAPGTHITVTPNTSNVFSSGGKVRYDLSQLASLQGPPPRKTYVRSFQANVDYALTNGAGSTQTIAYQQLFTLFQSVILQMQGHQFVNLPFNGGASIRTLNVLLFGKAPSVSNSSIGNTALSWAAAATTPTGAYGPTVKFIIPCYDPRGINPEEDVLPVGILSGTYLELQFTSTANPFGANFGAPQAGTKIRTLTAELIQRDEVRFPALWVIEERNQAGLSDFITPEGVLYLDVSMLFNPSAGQTWAGFTAAQLTNVVYTQTGMKTHDNLNPADIIALYNSQQGLATEGMLPDWESGNCDTLPIVWFPRSSSKKTHNIPDMNKPYLQLTGSLATTAFRMLLKYVKPLGPRGVADQAAKANQPLPAGFAQNPRSFIRPKSPAKVVIDPSKAQFLAQKVVTRPTAQAAATG